MLCGGLQTKKRHHIDYDLCPYLPVTRSVTPDFDNTTDDIEAITADMITKLNLNKDELPTDSCQQSGWQVFVLEFSHTLLIFGFIYNDGIIS